MGFRMVLAVGLLTVLFTLGSGMGVAAAHTDGDASVGHVLLEIIRWVGVVGAAIVLVGAGFWLRARWLRSREP